MARAVETDPAGFVTVNLAGNSDSYVYIPFKRSSAFVGVAASLGNNGVYDPGEPFTDNSPANGVYDPGEAFTDTDNVISLAGTPGFATNQFVYVSGTQPNRYYVFLKAGSRAGMYYSVVSNGTGSIVVDLAGDDLAAAGAITSNTTLEVNPFDTLGTIFPNGIGVNPSINHSFANRQTEVYLPDLSTAGKNLALTVSYYYYTGGLGAGNGWRKAGAAGVLANDEILPLDSFFVVRHNVSSGTSVTFTGTVQMSQLSTPIGTLVGSTDQDNAVALPFATEMSLADLKLYETGAFVGSPSHSFTDRKDEVLVWDNTVIGRNKSSNEIYYYYDGTLGAGKGWRKAGAAGTLANDAKVTGPNRGIVIRKKASASPTTILWSVKPPYVP
jgi:uncharacterized protein (TIGR02597 family)